jgi:hypothetical protein
MVHDDTMGRSVCVQAAEGSTLTVGQLSEMIWHLDDQGPALVDGRPIKFATPYAGVLYMDTGARLPVPCPACGAFGGNCCAVGDEP